MFFIKIVFQKNLFRKICFILTCAGISISSKTTTTTTLIATNCIAAGCISVASVWSITAFIDVYKKYVNYYHYGITINGRLVLKPTLGLILENFKYLFDTHMGAEHSDDGSADYPIVLIGHN